MIKNIAVIGAGTMGNGIAHVFAQFGYKVALIDHSKEALDKAFTVIDKNLDRQIKKELIHVDQKDNILKNISFCSILEDAVSHADLVIEAVHEHWETKRKLFTSLDALCPASTLLASNTSSISITKIAAATKRPDKVIGMHFMNPVPVMKLVEIIKGLNTSEETNKEIVGITYSIQKTPVSANDYPGFVSNRILMPLINEAIYTLYEGVAGIEEIDTVMRLGMSHLMGPLELADFIGLDVCLSIMNVLYNGFLNPKYAPCPLLVNMVEAGLKGVKSGEGFYLYEAGSKEKKVNKKF